MGSPERSTDAMREDISLSAWKALYQTAILEMRKEPPSDHANELGALAYSANFLAELRRLETNRHTNASSADTAR
jgi:hypothetical protein